jgi:hypothetical protein
MNGVWVNEGTSTRVREDTYAACLASTRVDDSALLAVMHGAVLGGGRCHTAQCCVVADFGSLAQYELWAHDHGPACRHCCTRLGSRRHPAPPRSHTHA